MRTIILMSLAFLGGFYFGHRVEIKTVFLVEEQKRCEEMGGVFNAYYLHGEGDMNCITQSFDLFHAIKDR